MSSELHNRVTSVVDKIILPEVSQLLQVFTIQQLLGNVRFDRLAHIEKGKAAVLDLKYCIAFATAVPGAFRIHLLFKLGTTL